jgi:hypothetical protein
MNFYWRWLFHGATGQRAGLLRFFDRWLPLHFVVGVACTIYVPASLKDAANTVLLPIAGLFIGLCFAWGGNAQALLQTSEIEELASHHKGGLEEYAFVYQTAILTVMIALVTWGIAGLDVFDRVWPRPNSVPYDILKGALFAWSSLTLRECWHVVLGAQLLLLTRRDVRGIKRNRLDSEKQK